MKCLETLPKKQMPNNIIMQTIRLYRETGKNNYYESLFSKDFEFTSKQLATLDAYSFYRCFYSDLKLPESRMKSLQLDSSKPKNRSEQLYKNILEIFKIIHAPKRADFELTVPEIHNLVTLLYKDYYPKEQLTYQKVDRQKHSLLSTESVSKREMLEAMIQSYQALKKSNEYEATYLHLNFMIDFMNMDVYKIPENSVIAILVYYILGMQEGMMASRYVSFFSRLLINIKEYQQARDLTRLNWKEGYSEIMPLHRFFLSLYDHLYEELEETARDYDYESHLEISKSDYIENTIDKLNQVFSKEDIRMKHPLISDSTINRTLKRLQEENKVRPLGKGRSAKWIKLYQKETKKTMMKQMNLDLEG